MAKTFRNLWPQLVSFDNLWAAYLAARRGKRARPGVAAYELAAETRLLRLQERLEDGSYQPGAYRTFAVREWKRRVAAAAAARSRPPTRRYTSCACCCARAIPCTCLPLASTSTPRASSTRWAA